MKNRYNEAVRRLAEHRLLTRAYKNMQMVMDHLPKDDPERPASRRTLLRLKRKVCAVNKALSALEPEQEKLLRMLYVDEPCPRWQLLEELNISEATFYRQRKAALKAFTMALLGKE